MSDWYLNVCSPENGCGGGGEVNNGNAISAVSTDVAHTGRYSANATITAPPLSAVRLFRFTKNIPEAYYSAWYYFPRVYTPDPPDTGHWIIFHYKSGYSSSVDPDPFWYLKVNIRSNGNMYLVLQWWAGPWPHGTPEGPHQGEYGGQRYGQTLKDLPVSKWVHIEAYLRHSGDFTGQIIVWQDGVEIFNENNVRTRYPSSPYVGADWALSNYSASLSPSPATIYFDDAVISLTRVGPNVIAPRAPTNLRIIR